MIAAGLCMMGGCFAQMDDSSVVDSYWPAAEILLPSTSSVDYYSLTDIPAGVELADCEVECSHQQMTFGVSAFFTVNQQQENTDVVLTVYTNYSGNPGLLDIQTSYPNGAPNVQRALVSPMPLPVKFYFRDSEASIPAYDLKNNEVLWDSSQPGKRVSPVRGNTAETLFFYSKGSWGLRWYVLPMMSVARLHAVFDFEQKVLVEI